MSDAAFIDLSSILKIEVTSPITKSDFEKNLAEFLQVAFQKVISVYKDIVEKNVSSISNNIFSFCEAENSISFNNFRSWFVDASSVDSVSILVKALQVTQGKESVSALVSLLGIENNSQEEIASIKANKISESTHQQEKPSLLFAFDVDELLSAFDEAIVMSFIDKELFVKCYENLSLKVLAQFPEAIAEEAEILFSIIDFDGDGFVNWDGVLSGLIIMCKGDSDEKLQQIFNLYDTNSDGNLSFSEMVNYFASVFKIMYKLREHSSGDPIEEHNVNFSDLAEATARQCFQEVGINISKGKFSLEQFVDWFHHSDFNHDLGSQSQHDDSEDNEILKKASTSSASSFDQEKANQDSIQRSIHLLSSLQASFMEMYSELETKIDENKHISHDQFVTFFCSSILPGEPKSEASELASKLFNLYVTEDGTASFKDLAGCFAALSSSWKTEDDLERLFALYDDDNDGVISLEQLENFFAAFGKTLRILNPISAKKLTGITEDAVGKICAEECFKSLDKPATPSDVRKECFTGWYTTMFHKESFRNKKAWEHYSYFFSFDSLRELTGFDKHYLREVLSLLTKNSHNPDGSIAQEDFVDVLYSLLLEDEHSAEFDALRMRIVLRILAKVLDLNNKGSLEVFNICSALSLLCKTRENDNVKAAFSVFNQKGDGFISFSEMKQYLTITFLLMYETDKKLRDRMGDFSPQMLAAKTAKHIFRKAHVNSAGKFPLKDLQEWCQSQIGDQESHMVQCEISVCDAVKAKSFTIEEVISISKLNKMSPRAFFSLLIKHTDENGRINHKNLYKVLRKVRSKTRKRSDERVEWQLKLLARKIIDLFSKGSKHIFSVDVASGFSIFCRGDEISKSAALFSIFDFDGDGVLQLSEVQRFMENVFKVVFAFDEKVKKQYHEVNPRELASTTAKDIFKIADTDGNGVISFEEFETWVEREGSFVPEKPANRRSRSKSQIHMVHSNEWQFLKSFSFLGNTTIEEVVQVFTRGAAEDEHVVGQLDNIQFFAGFKRLFQINGISPAITARQEVSIALHRLFNVLDVKKTQKIRFRDFIASLSLLCVDDHLGKAKVLFRFFDYDTNGLISLRELTSYFKVIFRMLHSTGYVLLRSESKKSIRKLAKVTAQQVFTEADLNDDGRLSFEEFVKWYTGEPHASVVPRKEENHHVEAPAYMDAELEALSLEDVSILFGFPHSMAVHVLRILSASVVVVDSKRILDLTRLTHCLSLIKANASIKRKKKTKALDHDLLVSKASAKLFKEFYTNSSSTPRTDLKIVELKEIAAGLCFMCMDENIEKLRVAFEFYDSDDDELLTKAQFQSYLTSVLIVVKQLSSQSTSPNINKTPYILAEEMTDQLFGTKTKVSFKEFWESCQSNSSVLRMRGDKVISSNES